MEQELSVEKVTELTSSINPTFTIGTGSAEANLGGASGGAVGVLNELTEHKILRPQKDGNEVFYLNDDLIRILEG